jgi:hypothetical protein
MNLPKKTLLTSLLLAQLQLIAKIIFEPTTADSHITQHERVAPSFEISRTLVTEATASSLPQENESYNLLEKNELVKKLIECCLTGDCHAIDSLFLKVRKKLEKDHLFSCAFGELAVLQELKDKGLVHTKCKNSFHKQLKNLTELVEKKISSADDSSALAALKPHISKNNVLKFALGKDSLDVKIFLKNIKSELRSSGCSEKNGQLSFEPGSYMDAISDLSIILANPAFFTDQDARSEVVKTIHSAYECGQRHFENSPYFPLVSKHNKEYLIRQYKELLICLINDYLAHEAFRTDNNAKPNLLALREKIAGSIQPEVKLLILLDPTPKESTTKLASTHKITSESFEQSKNKPPRRINKTGINTKSNIPNPNPNRKTSVSLFSVEKHTASLETGLPLGISQVQSQMMRKKELRTDKRTPTKKMKKEVLEPAERAARKLRTKAVKDTNNQRHNEVKTTVITSLENVKKRSAGTGVKKPYRS